MEELGEKTFDRTSRDTELLCYSFLVKPSNNLDGVWVKEKAEKKKCPTLFFFLILLYIFNSLFDFIYLNVFIFEFVSVYFDSRHFFAGINSLWPNFGPNDELFVCMFPYFYVSVFLVRFLFYQKCSNSARRANAWSYLNLFTFECVNADFDF